tara:strand:- start:4074 stop:4307 length:234 start_codon:yes stop_codon:yes gene_type:complete
MPMPKTTIYKYNALVFWENNIRLARQRFIMQFVPETSGMKPATNSHFRFRILSPDAPHVQTTLFFCEDVHSTDKASE